LIYYFRPNVLPGSSQPDDCSKFNIAKRILNELAQTMSRESESIFNDRLEQILLIKDMWEKNVDFICKPLPSKTIQSDALLDVSVYDLNSTNSLESSPESSESDQVAMDVCDVDSVVNNSIATNENSNDASTNSEHISENCQNLYISLHGKELLKKAPKRGAPCKQNRKKKVTLNAKENAKISQDNFLRELFDIILVTNMKKNIPYILSLNISIEEEHIHLNVFEKKLLYL